jgi:hypothetical protein
MYAVGHGAEAPACRIQKRGGKGGAGNGRQSSSEPHEPRCAASAAAQARAARDQLAGGAIATPPLGEHMPPVGAAPLTSNAVHAAGEAHVEAVREIGVPQEVPQLASE